jgi:hypothetical protein
MNNNSINKNFDRLRVGMRVLCNGDGKYTTTLTYEGVITDISNTTFTIKRNDWKKGGGLNGDWLVRRESGGIVEILEAPGGCAEFTTEKIELQKEATIHSSDTHMYGLHQKFIEANLTEPTKTLRKAGVLDPQGYLTTEGRDLFLAWLFNKNEDAFTKEAVTPILKEEKGEACK